LESKLSYYSCPSNEHLTAATVGQILGESVARYPDYEALVSIHQNVRLTYTEFNDICHRAATGLMSIGIEKGDNVAIWSHSQAESMITQFATAMIGAVLVTINPDYKAYELEYALRISESKVLLFSDRYKTTDYLSIFLEVCPEAGKATNKKIESKKLPFLKHAVLLGDNDHPDILAWSELLAMGDSIAETSLEARKQTLSMDDPLNMLFTSGTTDYPKAVVITHHNLVNNCLLSNTRLRFYPKDRFCMCLPLFHVFGIWNCLACIMFGATVVFPAERFNTEATLSAVMSEKCTILSGVPTMFTTELAHPDFNKYNLSTLRGGLMAGAPCPLDTVKKVMEKMHLPDLLIGFGLTEVAGSCTSTTLDSDIESRLNTVGIPLPYTEVKIIDPETKAIVPIGEKGELCCRGPFVMKEYYKNPEATNAQIDRVRWFHTGDMATIDANGYIQIVGRLKDMIIRGGENIYPGEIENFLLTHPKINIAQIVGVPDEKYGEELCAWIKPVDIESITEEEVRDFCDDKIARYKIPRYIKFVNKFPMTASGKIKKAEIKRIVNQEIAGAL